MIVACVLETGKRCVGFEQIDIMSAFFLAPAQAVITGQVEIWIPRRTGRLRPDGAAMASGRRGKRALSALMG